jgi:aminotransferase
VVNRLNEIGLPCHLPKGAFYAFPDITSTELRSTEFSLQLLRSKKVAVVPGSAFGVSGEGFVRCCFATGFDKLKEAMDRISEFVGEIGRR